MRCLTSGGNSAEQAIVFSSRLTSEERMVRKRGRANRGAGRGAAFVGIIAMLAGRVWGRLARRPVDSVAIIGAAAASLIIIVNAVFLQSGSQRAPFVANPTAPSQSAESRPDLSTSNSAQNDTVRASSNQRTAAPAPATARRDDPIADLIGSSVGSLRRGRTVE
jgi:hypothetical protein